ncbi:MAG: OmpH family outer membrane protein [Bacteroidetes bacterium]|uniref:OmpH family outer membrane protein n=1 Tax=Candidatus Cryptobacteroides excrementavium TaxID=2840759 RepID=A0A9D9NR26_9BACT|nr:OmpH family outer membrane protein [Candidatus Cryptobacteroides excrementavium]
MKQASLILSILAIVAVAVFGTLSFTGKGDRQTGSASENDSTAVSAVKGDIVYIQLDRILQEYDMANDLRAVVETKVQNIQAEVDRRGKKLEKEVNEFQEKLNKGLMTRSVAEVQSQKLQQQEAEFNNFANQKNNEILEEQTVMMNQLADAIKTYLDKYNEEKQYAMILTNQGGAPVITGSASLDITEEVLAGLNEEYVRNKSRKNN